MLVLSRKQNESIVVDGNIRVTIVHCGRGKVKIGIQAPDEVSILRGELTHKCEPQSTFPPNGASVANDLLTHNGAFSSTVAIEA